MSDAYVAIYPYSNTNPTAKYRVVKNDDFQAAINGEKDSYKYTEYDKLDAALDARDKLNTESVKG